MFLTFCSFCLIFQLPRVLTAAVGWTPLISSSPAGGGGGETPLHWIYGTARTSLWLGYLALTTWKSNQVHPHRRTQVFFSTNYQTLLQSQPSVCERNKKIKSIKTFITKHNSVSAVEARLRRKSTRWSKRRPRTQQKSGWKLSDWRCQFNQVSQLIWNENIIF